VNERRRTGAWAGGAIVVVAFLVLRSFFHPWKVPQDGMYPSYPQGALIWGRDHMSPAPADLRRGDVVVYEVRRDGVPYDFIWRVVGLPGESVEIRDDVAIIDGKPLQYDMVRRDGDFDILRERSETSSYTIALPHDRSGAGPSNHPRITVPADAVFLMGDNRHNAYDSRNTGPVPVSAIHGRAFR